MEDAKKTIAIGCDHAGYPYKDRIIAFLESEGWTVRDFGTDSPDSVDYPDFVHPTAEMVESGEAQLGIVLCGSGNGVAITANKHQGIRAALCWLPELASLAREHNNANMLALPVRFIEEETAVEITRAFLAASFEGGRHARRVGKIACG
ncbi:ribose 5-phosphate isomerase B [Phaeodactylibacter xiamenensis]|uniref:ribose 5-phosphate isomerase B n=1 Tax=Phaeodactylibacter xiamenensis TaxID=1524460 RepID=UPI003CCC0FFD